MWPPPKPPMWPPPKPPMCPPPKPPPILASADDIITGETMIAVAANNASAFLFMANPSGSERPPSALNAAQFLFGSALIERAEEKRRSQASMRHLRLAGNRESNLHPSRYFAAGLAIEMAVIIFAV